MNVEGCVFPDDRYYDVENGVWFQPNEGSGARMGITTIQVFVAGKISSIKFQPIAGIEVVRGKSLATLESIKYVGAVRSPVEGKISNINDALASDATPLWKSPYRSWIAQYEHFNAKSLDELRNGIEAKDALLSKIKELRIHCFKVLPDEEMYAIGTECTTTLANLSELLADKPLGYVVHLVTDDPTADIEMVRWSMQTGNEIVESRTEDILYHFIVEKTSSRKA